MSAAHPREPPARPCAKGTAVSTGKPASKKRQIVNEFEGRMNRGDLSSPARACPALGRGAVSWPEAIILDGGAKPAIPMSATHPVIRRWFWLLGLALALLLG